jgi:hypothetical protein
VQTFFVRRKPKERILIIALLGNLPLKDLIILIVAVLLVPLVAFLSAGPQTISLLSLLRNNHLPSRWLSLPLIISFLGPWWWSMCRCFRPATY